MMCLTPYALALVLVFLMHVARDLSKGHIRSALELERTWTAVAGARAINNGCTIVHRRNIRSFWLRNVFTCTGR